MEITLAYAEWVSSSRAFRLRMLLWVPITLILPAGWFAIGYDGFMVFLAVTYVIIFYGIKIWFERGRGGRAADAARFTRSTLQRH